MNTNSIIIEFIEKEASSLITYNFNEFFLMIYYKFYKNIGLNNNTILYLLNLDNDDTKCSIKYYKLKKYNIFNNNKELVKYINILKLKENIDYTKSRIFCRLEYNFRPVAFKKLILETDNTNKFRNYYLILEEIYQYFIYYQNSYKNKIVSKLESIIK